MQTNVTHYLFQYQNRNTKIWNKKESNQRLSACRNSMQYCWLFRCLCSVNFINVIGKTGQTRSKKNQQRQASMWRMKKQGNDHILAVTWTKRAGEHVPYMCTQYSTCLNVWAPHAWNEISPPQIIPQQWLIVDDELQLEFKLFCSNS